MAQHISSEIVSQVWRAPTSALHRYHLKDAIRYCDFTKYKLQ